MPLHNPRQLAFSAKLNKVFRVKGRGLIPQNNSLTHKMHMLTVYSGRGTAVHKHVEGGTIRNHHRPYELKDAHESKPHRRREFKPIAFKF